MPYCIAHLVTPLLLAGLQTSPAPAAPPRTRTFDLKHLALDLRFDWRAKQARGTATMTLAPFRPARQLTLDAGKLTIESVTTSSGTPLAFTYDGGDANDGLAVTLDRVYPGGADLTIRIAYRTNWINRSDPNNLAGSPGKGIRFFEPTSTEPRKRRQIWSMGDPESNRYWFPSYDAPDDLRTTEFTATVEPPLTAISNGTLVGTRTNPDGTRSYHWMMDRPYANHLTSFVIGEYTVIEQQYDGIPLRSFGYPDEAEAVAASVVRLPDMVRFFSEVTGVRYPYAAYAQVFVQDLPWGSGNATASTLTENMVDDARTHADYFYLWDGLEAEALAQQWFGGHLTARDWSHVWLNRGLAHYFDGLFNEHMNGRDDFLLWQLVADQGTYLADWASGNRHPIVTDQVENGSPVTTDNYAYARAAAVLHLLRTELGEAAWSKAVKQYVRTNAGRTVSTDDFREAVEDAAGRPMAWFFDQWFYRIGHPVFEVAHRYDENRKQLLLTVRQTQTKDPKARYPEVEFFQGSVDISVDGRIERVWLEPKALNEFALSTSSPPQLVSFDHGGAWIKELTFEKPLPELLYQLAHDRDVLGQRWAIAQLVARAANDSAPAADHAAVLDGLRQVILSKAYWRLRYGAILQLRGLLVPTAGAAPVRLDEATTTMLLAVSKEPNPWMRSQAVGFLGLTRDPRFADVYYAALAEESHPVIFAAAAALGKTKHPKAYAALTRLMTVPSWKGENVLSGLNGLKELGDRRGIPLALKAVSDETSPRWTLATPFWDFRIAGAETLVALGSGRTAYPLLLTRLKKSLAEADINDVFSNLLLIATIADPRAQEAFDLVTAAYQGDADAMTAAGVYQAQWKGALKKP